MPENPYQTPTEKTELLLSQSTRDWVNQFALITRHTILLLSLSGLLLFIVPFYANYFEGWELKTSAPLMYLIALSRFVSTFWYLAAIGVPLYFILLLKVRPRTPLQRVLFSVWTLFFWIFAIGIFPFAAFFITTPFISITTGLSK